MGGCKAHGATAALARLARPQRRGLMTEARVAVVGGGLTGLTTAYYLAQKLPEFAHITLYESRGRLGGWLQTDRVAVDVDGVRGTVNFERGARTLTSLATHKTRFDDLVLYDLVVRLGLPLHKPEDLARYIWYPDRLLRVPEATSMRGLVSEPLVRHMFWGLVGALIKYPACERLPVEDLSVAEWIGRISMGRSLATIGASAMIHGIYGGDIDKLSARAVLERFYWWYHLPKLPQGWYRMTRREYELMTSLSGDKQIRQLALEAKGSLLHFGGAGMEALPAALAAALGRQANVTVRTGAAVEAMGYDAGCDKVTVRVASARGAEPAAAFDRVVCTSSGQALARATGGRLPTLDRMSAVSIMTVNLWYPRRLVIPRSFGYLIPLAAETNPERALGVFFDSDVGVAGPDEPDGTKLFALLGGHYYDGETGARPPSEAEAVAQAKRLLERQLGISPSTPCHVSARLARDCIPQHTVGHADRMDRLHAELRAAFAGRLTVAGGSYSAIGAMAALRAGHDAATLVARGRATGLEHVTSRGPDDFVQLHARDIPVRRHAAG